MDYIKNEKSDLLKEIQELINMQFLNIKQLPKSGSSGNKIYLFDFKNNDKMYALKIAQISRVLLCEEKKRNQLLKKYLPKHVPSVIFCKTVSNHQIMISECPGEYTLHNAIVYGIKPHSELLNIWVDILDEIYELWRNSKIESFSQKNNLRNYQDRFNRIKDGVLNYKFISEGITLQNYSDYIIQVNGTDYCSLTELFDYLENMDEPSFSVFCHGDVQPTNIVISEDNNWYFVDWEWVGNGYDWRMMFAHIFGWWGTRMTNMKSNPTIKIQNQRIVIEIDEIISDFIYEYQTIAISLFHKMTDKNSIRTDIRAINKYLSLLYLGDIRFLHIWNREHCGALLLSNAVRVISANKTINKKNDIYYIYNSR